MNKILFSIRTKILPSLGLGLFAIASVAMAGAAALKLSGTATNHNSQNENTSASIKGEKDYNDNTQAIQNSNNAGRVTPAPAPLTQAASNRCLIMVNGQTYDITSFRDAHPGGNVFECGTDMSALFASAHSSDIDRLRPFLVANGSGLATAQTSPPSSVTTAGNDEGEEESREHGSEREFESEDD